MSSGNLFLVKGKCHILKQPTFTILCSIKQKQLHNSTFLTWQPRSNRSEPEDACNSNLRSRPSARSRRKATSRADDYGRFSQTDMSRPNLTSSETKPKLVQPRRSEKLHRQEKHPQNTKIDQINYSIRVAANEFVPGEVD